MLTFFKTRVVSLFTALSFVASASGCGGGGSTLTPSMRTTNTPAQPTVAPVAQPTMTNAPSSVAATATVTIVIPRASATASRRRRPNYVSPATNSLTFAQNGGATKAIPLTSTSPSCTASATALTCTATVSVLSGLNQSFTVKTFASADGSGAPLSAQTIVSTIVAGQSNPLAFTLNGVVSSLTLALSQWVLPAGRSGTTNVVVNALDASGNTIVGPGVFADSSGNPITVSLANSDTSGATQLGTQSITQATTVPLTYNGAPGITTATITASAVGFTAQAIVVSIDSPGVKLAPDQVAGAMSDAAAAFATMPHVDLYDDLNTLATAMVQSGAFEYAVQTPGGISALLSDGTPALVFADHAEEFAYTSAMQTTANVLAQKRWLQSRQAKARSAAPSASPTPVPTQTPTPLAPGPGPAAGHEIAILVNKTDTTGAFTPARQTVFGNAFTASGFTAAAGYNVDVLSITIDNIIALGSSHPLDLLNIATHGIVFSYIPSPGVTLPPSLPAENYANLSDTDYSAALQSQYQSDFNAGNLVVAVQLAFGGVAGLYPHIAFTPAFVASRVAFNPGALVLNSSCLGQNPDISGAVGAAYQGAGAGRYIGWTKEVDGTDADETDAFLYDRLLGEQSPSVTKLEQYVTPRNPVQRPFPLDAIDTVEMTELRSGPITRRTEPYTNSDDNAFVNTKAPPLPDGTLARLMVSELGAGEMTANAPVVYGLPTIASMNVVESASSGLLTINGNFPMNPGTITVTDSSGTLTLQPVDWSTTQVTATIPASGAQSAGMVQVLSAEGIASNPAPLTQWTGMLNFKENDSIVDFEGTTGSGSGTIAVKYNIAFRADVHPTVKNIDTNPVAQNFTFESVEGNSTANVTVYTGKYVSDDGKVIANYAISPTTLALTPVLPPLQPGTFEVRAVTDGSEPSPCNNGMPGPQGGAGTVQCPITGWYVPDGSVTCTDSGENSACPQTSLYDEVGSYGDGFDAGGLLSMTMDPTTFAVSVTGTTTQYATIHFGGGDSDDGNPATASMSGIVAAPSYTPAPTGASAVHRTPAHAAPPVRLRPNARGRKNLDFIFRR